jgi:hypothetical protein
VVGAFEVVVSTGGRGVFGQVEDDGQSHSFLLSFHSSPAGHGITCGLPEPSGCGTHWMNELQLAGFGYKQSLGPIHPVFAISSLGHWNPLSGGLVGVCVGAAVDASVGFCVGAFVGLLGQVESCGQSHSFLLSFHSRRAGQGITCGLPEPSGCGTHCMNELQLAGFGYKQSLGPIHPVFAMSSLGQTKLSPDGGGVVGSVGG